MTSVGMTPLATLLWGIATGVISLGIVGLVVIPIQMIADNRWLAEAFTLRDFLECWASIMLAGAVIGLIAGFLCL